MVDVAWRKDSWVGMGGIGSHLEAGLLEMTTSGNGRGKYQVKETRMVSLLAMNSECLESSVSLANCTGFPLRH